MQPLMCTRAPVSFSMNASYVPNCSAFPTWMMKMLRPDSAMGSQGHQGPSVVHVTSRAEKSPT